MPVGPQRFQYPKTEEEATESGLTPVRAFAQVHQLHGVADPEALFKGHVTSTTPWPRAGRSKHEPLYNREAVHAALRDPHQHIREVDPRFLHANQPEVTRAGVKHYMGDEYRQTGRTFADQHMAGNRWPFVYTTRRGMNVILSGHHRATAALLNGDQLRAIHIEE